MVLTACGSGVTADKPVTYAANAVSVLENPDHGPQLCAAMAESLPPQCGGPDIVGWDWSKVQHESVEGTKWGHYRVVGTWDGSRLTLTESPGAVQGTPKERRFDSPCPVPEGGWRPVDPAKTTQEALEATQRRLENEAAVGGVWLDQSYLDSIPGYDGSKPEWAEKYANDPAKLVLNVKFTGDMTGREAWIRESWGGALCVSRAQRSQEALRQIQESIGDDLSQPFTSTSVDIMKEQVVAGVWVADEELQQRLEDKYGEGVVLLQAALKPVQ
ncbi:hypothetical protein HD597_000703 [Nonomuraea thailandensis]|uniref:Uncharacterized protein n=1 Tax=Nonomuraea thailandensis TaxID=1188745 RepID=A0A9X2GGI8_9ACTN|nr:hypothetical protein [Nonomuraea thailandensis]MCP2353683.1 hypothetical protein [Nonomuraea thailandensis]